jgi:TolC family type I secretion outer membrane protein
MNQKLYKKILITMMVTAVGSTAAFASNGTTTQSTLPFVGKVAAKTTVDSAKSDVSSSVREALAQKIMKATEKRQAAAAKKGNNPVFQVGTVPVNQTVELTLPKTVQMALDSNRDIKVARYGLQESDWSVAEARAGLMPSLDYTFKAGRTKNYVVSTLTNNFSNALTLSLPLYTGGAVEGSIAVAKLGRDTSQEEIFRVEQATKLSAVQGYFNLLAYQELKAVYDESVSNLQGHVDNVTAQYNVGTVAKLDVLTSDVSLANARTNAVSAANNVSNAEANLNNILGLPLQTKLVVADHRLPFDAYNISLDEAIDYAMQYRPEVLQSALAVQKAEENIGIAEAGHRPTVAVGASNAWADEDFPGSKKSTWALTGGITYSFYDGGATNAKIHVAKAALLAAEETEQKTREAVALQVKQAYLNIRSAAQRVEATQAAVNQAEESFKIARVRYTAGVGINLDVLDAQLNLNTAKTNNISALYDYNVGIATLEQVMGVDVRSGVVRIPQKSIVK